MIEFLTIAVIISLSSATAITMRYFKYKETVALAKEGLLRENNLSRRRQNGSGRMHKRGIVLTAIGTALTLGLLTLGIGPWLVGGFLPLFTGLAFIFLSSKEDPLHSFSEEEIEAFDNALLDRKENGK